MPKFLRAKVSFEALDDCIFNLKRGRNICFCCSFFRDQHFRSKILHIFDPIFTSRPFFLGDPLFKHCAGTFDVYFTYLAAGFTPVSIFGGHGPLFQGF